MGIVELDGISSIIIHFRNQLIIRGDTCVSNDLADRNRNEVSCEGSKGVLQDAKWSFGITLVHTSYDTIW